MRSTPKLTRNRLLRHKAGTWYHTQGCPLCHLLHEGPTLPRHQSTCESDTANPVSSAACEGAQAALPAAEIIQGMPSESSVVHTPPGHLRINETFFYIWVSLEGGLIQLPTHGLS